MKFSRGKKSLLLFMIGFLFLICDLNIDTHIAYPQDYDNSDTVVGEFQYYNIKSTYGATCTYKYIDEAHSSSLSNVPADEPSEVSPSVGTKVIDEVFYDNIHIDVFHDVIGLILIFYATLLLCKSFKQFRYALILSVISILLNMILFVLPFFLNGMVLCNFVFITGFAYIFAQIFTTFFYTQGVLKLIPGVACRDERGWMWIVWYIIAVVSILTTFIYWLGSDYPALIVTGNIFTFIIACLIITYYLLGKRVLDYINENYNAQILKK